MKARDRHRREGHAVGELAVGDHLADLRLGEEADVADELELLGLVLALADDLCHHDVLRVGEESAVGVGAPDHFGVPDDEARLLCRLELRRLEDERVELLDVVGRRDEAARSFPALLAEHLERLAPAPAFVETCHVLARVLDRQALADHAVVLDQPDLRRFALAGDADHHRAGVLDHEELVVEVAELPVDELLDDAAEDGPAVGVDVPDPFRGRAPADEGLAAGVELAGFEVFDLEESECAFADCGHAVPSFSCN